MSTDENRAWHSHATTEVANELTAHTENGLSEQVAATRAQEHGPNELKAFLKKAKDQHPQATGGELCVQVWERFEIDLSLSRLNELLHAEGLSNAPGRPHKGSTPEMSSAAEREVDNAGAFFPLWAR